MASVTIDLMIVIRSATWVRCGMASEISAPDCPCLANLNSEAYSAASGLMNARLCLSPIPAARLAGVSRAPACNRTNRVATARRPEKVDHALCPRREVRFLRSERTVA